MSEEWVADEHCEVCVYYPPNLPVNAYSKDDYRMLQEKKCSFDFQPHAEHCQATRKTSCLLVDLESLKQFN
jgi:hypothetical protein